MSAPIPTIEPSTVTAGDTVKWQRSLPDYPASAGWLLKYALRGASAIDITADSNQLVNVPSSVTSSWAAGSYSVQGYVTLAGEQHTVYQGPLTIAPSLVAAGADYDGRSHAKRVLDAIEAVIEGRAARGDQEMTIDGTRLVKMSVEQLKTLRVYYRREYQAEQRKLAVASGKKNGRRVLMRFRND